MQPTFARVKLATLDPFVHMNQDGRVRTPPEARGHPLTPTPAPRPSPKIDLAVVCWLGLGRRGTVDVLPRLEVVGFPVHAASPSGSPPGASAALCGLAADRL
jgi:hypothetical protein